MGLFGDGGGFTGWGKGADYLTMGVPGLFLGGQADAARAERDAQSEIYGAAANTARPAPVQHSNAWANLTKDRLGIQQSGAIDATHSQANQAAAGAWANLAARRGGSSGAAERLARDSNLQGMLNRQDIRRQGTMDNLGVDIKNEEMRKAVEMNNYNEGMRAWAAAQQAKAQYDSRDRGLFGGGGFLGLGLF